MQFGIGLGIEGLSAKGQEIAKSDLQKIRVRRSNAELSNRMLIMPLARLELFHTTTKPGVGDARDGIVQQPGVEQMTAE
jgi:hypothetical protein